MTTMEILRQKAGDLARRLDVASELQLRRATAAITQAAVERAGLSHPVISLALAHLRASASPHPQLRERVQALAEKLDAEYFELKQPYETCEDAGKTEPEVVIAFSKARAASAVAAALGNDARTAAAEAAYEAVAATDDYVYLADVADGVLTR